MVSLWHVRNTLRTSTSHFDFILKRASQCRKAEFTLLAQLSIIFDEINISAFAWLATGYMQWCSARRTELTEPFQVLTDK